MDIPSPLPLVVCSVTTHSLPVDCCPTSSEQLEEHLPLFWELEATGIPETEKTLYNKFTNNIVF